MPALVLLVFTLIYSLLAATPQVAQHMLADRLARLAPHGKVKVEIRADPPIRALGGEIDKVGVDITNGVIGGVPFNHLALVTGKVSYDTIALLFRKQLELTAPLDASGSVDLSDAGLTKLLDLPEIRDRLRNIPIPGNFMPGFGVQPHIDLEPRKVTLSDDGTVQLSGLVVVSEIGLVLPFAASAKLVLLDAEHVTIATPEVEILGNRLRTGQLLGHIHLPVFDLATMVQGVTMHLDELDIMNDELHVQGHATLAYLPKLPPAIQKLLP